MILYQTILALSIVSITLCKVSPDVFCSDSTMDIKFPREGVDEVLLEKWSQVPGCETTKDQHFFSISLKLSQELQCGLTKIRNKVTDEVIYYHKLIVKETEGSLHSFKVSCFLSSQDLHLRSNIVKRNVFPPEFVEPDYIEIIREVSGKAPVPQLSVGVRQSGSIIGDQVTVSPGAPLTMEVYLDSNSSGIYGILVSYMMVSDTTDKNETIIFNGCTQDRYVFENFETNDGDYLTAKFRAFKFPESSYLFFKGTVDVCLDKCQGIRCSSGELGYGRKKRALPVTSADPNKLFEVSMTTFLKFEQEVNPGSSSLLGESTSHPGQAKREEEIFVEEILPSSEDSPFYFFGHWSESSAASNQHVCFFFSVLLVLIPRIL